MKKYLKSFFVLALCLLLMVVFTACKSDDKESLEPTATQDTTTSASVSNTETTGETTEETEETTTATSSSVDAPSGDSNTQINTPGAVQGGSQVGLSYFDDAAFVGDSVSLKLSYYAAATGALGNAQFFTSGSLGAGNALWEVSDESVHPSYNGVKMLIEDCVANSGASKVYIMLGMNDIGLYGIDDTIKNYEELVGRIKAKSPNVQIVVQSMTPMTSTSNILGSSLNNDNIKIYNNRLSELCKKNGWAFVDVASVMYDAQGINLNRDFCSDPDGMGVHFTEAGCEKWIDYLTTHTP